MTWPHVDLSIDHKSSLVQIRLVGEVTDDLGFTTLFRFLDEHPGAWTCDTIVDIRDYTESITAAGLARVAAEYRRRFGGLPAPRRITVVVCNEPRCHEPLLKLLAAYFPGCFFRLAEDAIDAESLVAAMARLSRLPGQPDRADAPQ